MKKILKYMFIFILIIIVLIVLVIGGFVLITNYNNAHYYEKSTPKGEIETKYTPLGEYEVSYIEFESNEDVWKKYEVWYPSKIAENDEKYPLVVMANGTGVKASQYKEVFKHLASWGFIVVGNEDDNSRTGKSSSATLEFMLNQNSNKNSIFFNKVDVDNIGIAGHSQGGVGAINAVTNQDNGHLYKAMFVASTTSPYWSQNHIFGKEWSYDMSKITIPIFMVAGTGYADAGTAKDIKANEGQGICPLWAMNENYNFIPNTIDKVMARQIDKDHGDMLRSADAYMTAWFMAHFKNDVDTSDIMQEIQNNGSYQDVRVNDVE